MAHLASSDAHLDILKRLLDVLPDFALVPRWRPAGVQQTSHVLEYESPRRDLLHHLRHLSVDVHADLSTVTIRRGDRVVSSHARHWGRHQTIPDPAHLHAAAHHAGRFPDELKRLARIPLLVIDEIGYLPFEPDAANLFFQLISARYERASVIVTSNKPFRRWGEVFGDDTVAAAMIDHLVHHAEIISIKGDSYRLKDRDVGRTPPAAKTE